MLSYTILPEEYQRFLSLILNERLCSISFSQFCNTQSSLRQLFPFALLWPIYSTTMSGIYLRYSDVYKYIFVSL